MKFLTRVQKYQLYLLQLENYELFRYWRLVFKKGLGPKPDQRKTLVWTGKAAVIMGVAEVLTAISSVGAVGLLMGWPFGFWGVLLALAAFACLQAAQFLFFSVAVLLFMPADYLFKKILVLRARRRLASFPALKVIGIAGSYGKTTMKEILHHVLAARFVVAATPESVNTPVGIARWILKQVSSDTQVLVVEMGEHYRGDVAEICSLAKPDIAVVTGVNEAHLERLKNLETAIETVFEIVSSAKPGAYVLINGDDENAKNNYKKFVWPDHRVESFQKTELADKKFNPDELCWEAGLPELGRIKTFLLGEYVLGDVSAAVKIGRSLGLSRDEIVQGLAQLRPVPHRLQPIRSAGNVLVIDDAYNGNSAGVAEAIGVLSHFSSRRKLVLTPGLVETGAQAEAVHRQIGQKLAGVADLVMLIKNSVTPFIAQGLKDKQYPPEQILWYASAPEAHENLKNVLKPGDVILFQNDWGDQYL